MLTFRLKGLKDGPILSFLKLAVEIVLTIGLAVLNQIFIKQFFNVEPDEHIFKFLQAKFEIAQTDDFDAKLYLCNGAFNFMPRKGVQISGVCIYQGNELPVVRFRNKTWLAKLHLSYFWRKTENFREKIDFQEVIFLCSFIHEVVCLTHRIFYKFQKFSKNFRKIFKKNPKQFIKKQFYQF